MLKNKSSKEISRPNVTPSKPTYIAKAPKK